MIVMGQLDKFILDEMLWLPESRSYCRHKSTGETGAIH